MEIVNIEVTEPGDDFVVAEDELWLTVTGPDPLPDFHRIRQLANSQHGLKVHHKPLKYFPSWGGPDEPYTELWLVRKDMYA